MCYTVQMNDPEFLFWGLRTLSLSKGKSVYKTMTLTGPVTIFYPFYVSPTFNRSTGRNFTVDSLHQLMAK